MPGQHIIVLLLWGSIQIKYSATFQLLLYYYKCITSVPIEVCTEKKKNFCISLDSGLVEDISGVLVHHISCSPL